MAENRTNRSDPPHVLIVCVSEHHGNTREVADALAAVLHAQVVEPEAVDVGDLDRYDLVGFGSGIYFGVMHPRLIELVDALPPGAGRGAFTFSTSGMFLLPWLGTSGVQAKLRDRGYRVLGDFNCRGFDTVGPLGLIGGINRGHPDDADLDRATVFARDLRDRTRTRPTTRT